ncbi:MAG: phosphoribosylformylglycinamidine synthase [Lentisphaerae bacterium]|nr:phosphoribosylformylglycinamidine synthase [Lentisphaerota bacterium]
MMPLHHIACTWNPELPDARCASIRRQAARHLGLHLNGLKHISLYAVRADVPADALQRFAREALADAVAQQVAIDQLPESCGGFASFILVGKLPGTTDDEGLSAQRTLHDLLGLPFAPAPQEVFSSDLYLLEDALADDALRHLGTELLGNPLVNQITCGPMDRLVLPVPEEEAESEPTVETISLDVSDGELEALSKARLLSLNLAEMKAIQAYFRDPKTQAFRREVGLPPEPTDADLEILAQTWSEHCKHKGFNALIRYVDKETGAVEIIDSLFKTYIRAGTEAIARRLEEAGNNWLVKVFNDNAGVVRIDGDRLFVFKVETHNSPSALDPFGGAITGILGNNRDPLGTGRGGAALLFNTDVLCFGPPDHDEPLLPGQLHPRRVFAGVRQGIEEGGNKSGIPTINGAIVFDPRYAGKPLVYCGTGAVMADRYNGRKAWEKEIAPGDLVVMAGGRVGKDGIHGATFSSLGLDKHSPRSAVQIGSPITQKMLSDFLVVACGRGLVKCATDNGAGGLSSSIGELAPMAGGAEIWLERVPLKYPGLQPWEIFLSESQERMTLVVEKEREAELAELAALYEVESTVIGQFTDSGLLEVSHGGRPVAQLGLDFLHDGLPRKHLDAEWVRPAPPAPAIPADLDHADVLKRLLASDDICSREAVIRQYDHEVKGRTVLKPLMGPRGIAPQDAGVMRLDFEGWRGVAVSCGIVPRYGDLDAYQASAAAFDEAVRQIVSVGGQLPEPGRLGESTFWCANDNFCVPDSVFDPEQNPDGKYKLAQLVRMCQALADLAVAYHVPMTSGKDSMKNDFRAGGRKISVPPTVLYSVAADIADVRRTVTSEIKDAGAGVYVLGRTRDELGASAFQRLFGPPGGQVPVVRPKEALALYYAVMAANREGLIRSSHDLSDGGLAVALAEIVFGTGLGVQVAVDAVADSSVVALYSESPSRLVVTVKPEHRARFEELLGAAAVQIGETLAEPRFRIECGGGVLVDCACTDLERAWQKELLS